MCNHSEIMSATGERRNTQKCRTIKHLSISMYKMEQLMSKQMWRGNKNCVTIAIKVEHHTETISCVRFCYGATKEEKLRPPSCANGASQICLQPRIGSDCGHSVLAFYIFYGLCFVEIHSGISYWTTCNLHCASVKTGGSSYTYVNSFSKCFHSNKISE